MSQLSPGIRPRRRRTANSPRRRRSSRPAAICVAPVSAWSPFRSCAPARAEHGSDRQPRTRFPRVVGPRSGAGRGSCRVKRRCARRTPAAAAGWGFECGVVVAAVGREGSRLRRISGLAPTGPRDRSTVEEQLALRPEFSAQVRMPPTARSAPRGERRGLMVLTAGPVGALPRAQPSPLVSSPPDDARGFSPSFFRAAPIEGWEGRNTMTQTERNFAPRRGDEQDRERGSRRVSHAVDAQRRLNTRRADNTRTKAHPLGPRDPRHAYLTESHD